MTKKNYFLALSSALFFFLSIGICESTTITVSTVSQLVSALSNANSSGGNATILLENGTYTLSDTLYVNSPNITFASVSGIREKVIIQGDAMSANAQVGSLFRVTAGNFQIRDLTLQKCRWHLIQIAGENNADSPIIKNCIFRDSYEQMLKVTFNENYPSLTSDNGLVEKCLFEYSAGIGPQYYIGGVDALAAKNWRISNNVFKYIISPSQSVAQFAVHFWTYSSNNIVEKNLIIDCDRGIGFGLSGGPNAGGIIRNNMIYHSANKGQFADVGISLWESPDTKVYNNTVFLANDFPWAIEYRFSSTSNVFIVNNLTNKPIVSRDEATGIVTNNVTNAVASWFADVLNGDLHLKSKVNTVVDTGQVVLGLEDDFDGNPRPQGGGIDIGADEFLLSSPPLPPRNLRILTQQ
jgi:hypothetical protein